MPLNALKAVLPSTIYPFNRGGLSKGELVRFEFEVAGVKQLDRALGLLKVNVKDLRFIWDDIYDDFRKGGEKLFGSEGKGGSRGNAKWRKLSTPYAAYKARVRPGRKILVFDGNLKSSLTQKGASGAIYQKSKLSLTMGSSIPYALYHQTGTRRGLPKRPPIDLSNAQKNRWLKLIHEGIWKSGQGFLRGTL